MNLAIVRVNEKGVPVDITLIKSDDLKDIEKQEKIVMEAIISFHMGSNADIKNIPKEGFNLQQELDKSLKEFRENNCLKLGNHTFYRVISSVVYDFDAIKLDKLNKEGLKKMNADVKMSNECLNKLILKWKMERGKIESK